MHLGLLSLSAPSVLAVPFLLIFMCQVGRVVEGTSFDEDVTISLEQKRSIDKLRARVLPYITENFMKDDIYLVRWLRATDFDIPSAERRLIDNIKWRKDNNILTIDQEDFTDISAAYPISSVGFDREGRPLFILFAGEWDLRNAVITGRMNRVFRYLYQTVEMVTRRIRQYQQEGRNVTQATCLIDVEQFSLVQHACIRCIVRVIEVLQLYEVHYPGLADQLILVNVPPAAQAMLQLGIQAISKETRAALRVYGTNKAQWKEALQKSIDKKYLPVELGGTAT